MREQMTDSNLKIAFMGSPEISVPTLKALADNYTVTCVVTQPDREAGRGKKITQSAVKQAALDLGLPILQPERLRKPEAFEELAAYKPDLIVVLAYGQILRSNVLELPRYGCINVHASMLPKWRGASPIQAALLAGDKTTGVTIMKMDTGVDTGDILSTEEIPVEDDDTCASLSAKLAVTGAELLVQTLPLYLNGSITPEPQNNDKATFSGLIKKQDGELDFSQSASALERKVRAFNPWPSAFFDLDGAITKVHKARIEPFSGVVPANSRSIIAGFPAIAAVDGWLVLEEIQPAGKKSMSGKAYLSGCRTFLSDIS